MTRAKKSSKGSKAVAPRSGKPDGASPSDGGAEAKGDRPSDAAPPTPDTPDPGPYRVGRGKPPLHSQWQKGQSGYPSGRKKGSENVVTMALRVLRETIPAKLGGRRKTVSQLEGIFRMQLSRALTGDGRAFRNIMDFLRGLGVVRDSESEEAPAKRLSPEERKVVDDLLKSLDIDFPPNPLAKPK